MRGGAARAARRTGAVRGFARGRGREVEVGGGGAKGGGGEERKAAAGGARKGDGAEAAGRKGRGGDAVA